MATKPTTPKATALNVHQKIAAITAEIGYIQSDEGKKAGKKIGFNYVSLPLVLSRVKPLLEKYGLAITSSINNGSTCEQVVVVGKYGESHMYSFQAMKTYTIVDIDNPGDSVDYICPMMATNNDPAKAFGSAATYSMRFFLKDAFLIEMADLDPDEYVEAPDESGSASSEVIDELRSACGSYAGGDAAKIRTRIAALIKAGKLTNDKAQIFLKQLNN